MAGLARFLVSERYQKPLIALIWLVVFVLCMAVVLIISAANMRDSLRTETDKSLAEYIRLRTNVLSTFDRMDEWLTAIPCSPEYMVQLRRVAFLPDGINEFGHVRDGAVICSGNAGTLAQPVPLGPPDISGENPFAVSFWLDRDLAFLALEGLTATIVVRGPHMMVVPMQPPPSGLPGWLDQEVVVQSEGDWWHRSGTPGLYATALDAPSGPFPHRGSYFHTGCDPVGLHCVTSRIPFSGIFNAGVLGTAIVLLGTAIFAAMAAVIIHGRIRQHWSFDARFRRHVEEGVVCAYQPLMSTRTGEIVGCEVLARWRDLDGTIVYPNVFLPVAEKANLTLPLTLAVVRTALRELSSGIGRKDFQINFNISPRDFSVETLATIFPPGAPVPDGMRIVAEIVETESLPVEPVQTAIARLRERGIATYIDDFGVGYSNMHTLALLDVEGVKIDRSFAMAPDNSIMARILGLAIEMSHASGRAIVVEGVETRERLEMLRANPLVDIAQGYYIARPLTIDAFRTFLAAWTPFGGPPKEKPASRRRKAG
ncbi:EAL domain-containing protein [Pelagibacterium sediminicola]|uniref:EAL domain-containing protein n=1 Tax=Pelagibacterium sediminicola TaxID=2248761 RepID=UPI0018E5848E|nr:EAL domain-containing protein [Pelagibacterium sediminicola]